MTIVKVPNSDFTNPGDYPRSPHETLAGYVIAARTLDKCRAAIADKLGEYKFDCPLDNFFFDFTGLTAASLREFVSTGADDKSVEQWITDKANPHQRREIIQWNNDMRGKRICDLPIQLQEFLEDYIPKCVPAGHPIYVWFDVYDIEEERRP